MAPTAARRAKWVQRSCSRGLRGNPDACNPGRGSARDVTANRAGGNTRPVFALSVQPSAAMNPRIGGSRVGGAPRPFLSHRFLWERKRCPGRAGPLREGGILYERATTGRPYGRRAESSRPTEPTVAEANGRMISAPTGHGDFHASLAFTRRAPAGLAEKFKQIVNCGGPLFRKRPFLIAFWGAEV